MNKPGFRPDVFREGCCKRNYIVTGGAFDFVYSLDRKARGAFDLVDCITRYCSHVCVNFADGDFHVEPFLKSVFVCPDGAHLRACVSFNHKEGLTIMPLFPLRPLRFFAALRET